MSWKKNCKFIEESVPLQRKTRLSTILLQVRFVKANMKSITRKILRNYWKHQYISTYDQPYRFIASRERKCNAKHSRLIAVTLKTVLSLSRSPTLEISHTFKLILQFCTLQYHNCMLTDKWVALRPHIFFLERKKKIVILFGISRRFLASWIKCYWITLVKTPEVISQDARFLIVSHDRRRRSLIWQSLFTFFQDDPTARRHIAIINYDYQLHLCVRLIIVTTIESRFKSTS